MPPKKPTTPAPVTAHTHVDKRANTPTEELLNSWNAMNTIRAFLQGKNVDGIAPMFQG